MAQTFKVQDGDVVVENITGRPNMIGNPLGGTDIGKSRAKSSQDIRRCLSISRIKDGSGAGINDLIGTIEGGGFTSVSILIKSRIRSMFAVIQSLQKRRPSVRPPTEQFNAIVSLVVTQLQDRTAYRFRLDTRTFSGRIISQSGIIQG